MYGPHSVQATVAIAGIGAAQKSYIGTFIGDYFKDFNVNSTFNSGSYNGSYRLSSTDQAGRTNLSHSTLRRRRCPFGLRTECRSMIYSQTSYSSSSANNGTTVTSGTTTVTYQAGLHAPASGPSTDYRVQTLASRTANPAELRGSRTTQTMTGGYVGGIVESSTSAGAQSNRTIGVDGAFPAQLTLQTNATGGSVAATINISKWDGSTTSAQFHLGDATGRRAATHTFINDQIYALRDCPSGTFTTQLASVTTSSGTSTGADVTARTNLTSYGEKGKRSGVHGRIAVCLWSPCGDPDGCMPFRYPPVQYSAE